MNKMIGKISLSLLFVVLFAFIAKCSEQKSQDKMETQKTSIQKFQDQKFGMFIHWGIYAVPAGVWQGRYVRGIGEWIMNFEKIPVKEYEALAGKFNPIKFDADEWSRIAQDAGMKYMVITSKHHDGFAMYHSKASNYNIIDRTPFARDPLKELAEANARNNIGFGFYYSQAQDWHEPNAAGNNWDFPEKRDPKSYVEGKVLPQVEELLSGYGDLALFWFDTPQLLTKEQAMSLKKKVKDLQPACLVNNRIGFNLGDYFQMGDNAIPTMVYDSQAWEVPATLNDTWGFKKDDTNWKHPRDLIYKLADIASKGGNYLLNVGPTAEGIIPQACQKILRTMGQWLKVNGESIYETSPTPFFYPGITWKCTAKPNRLYFHIVNWPGTQLKINGLESNVKKAWFLANKKPVEFTQTATALTFSLPAQPLDEYNTVIALEIEDEKPKIASGFGYRDSQKEMNLYARDARIRGEEARYDWDSQSVSGYINSDSPKNELFWYHFPYEQGIYRVSMEYACDNNIAGSTFYFYNRKEKDKKYSGTIQGTDGKFRVFELGNFKMTPNTENLLVFGLDDDKSAGVKVRKIVLNRID